MNLTLILIVVILVLIILAVVLIYFLKKDNSKIKHLEEEVKTQQQNILYLYKHAEELALIEKDEKLTEGKIQEAKSDEEVLDIINAILAVNNGRV